MLRAGQFYENHKGKTPKEAEAEASRSKPAGLESAEDRPQKGAMVGRFVTSRRSPRRFAESVRRRL